MTTDQIKYRLEAPYKTEMAMKEKSYSREHIIFYQQLDQALVQIRRKLQELLRHLLLRSV